MDLNAIMDAIGTSLSGISGLRVFPFSADSISVPAAVVSMPDNINYDFTMARGSDQISLKVHILVSEASDRNARNALSPYVTSFGSSSIKAVLEADPSLGGTAQTMRVAGATIGPISVGTISYLAASFTLDIVA